MAALLPTLILGLPSVAGAQGTSTTHAVKLSLKGLFQTQNSSGQDQIGKTSLSEKSLFEQCTGNAPTRTQGLFLVIDCAFPNHNRIVAAETAPVSVLAVLGDIHLESEFAATAESRTSDLATLVAPASLDLECDDLEIEAEGVITLKYAPLSTGGPICPVSASFGMAGAMEREDEHTIIDLGSKLSAGKPSSSVHIPLEDPND